MNPSPRESGRNRAAVPQGTANTDPTFRISHLCVPATESIAHSLGQVSGDILAAWGLRDDELAYAVRMSVRELVGNAVKHGPQSPDPVVFVSFQLGADAFGPDRVTVTVQDQGRGQLAIPVPEDFEEAEEFRGLTVVSGYGARIESIVHPAGHTVMAWIPVAAADRERVCRCLCWGHQAVAPHCRGLVDPDTGTLFTGPCGMPIAVCRACADAITASCFPALAAADEAARLPILAATPGGG
ncbi:MAG TPA: ATP-binding protein [Actinocrinis sp.]|uniref:ATP-binding protein n=1 Tax=Actinocrinis sp. TaxID=1920516 RepID=UPI002DDCA23A|nr:ATP-binding protein [Actinocrinis sp.]HEV2347892.1 ATP-binding protein [Actinocrinis sp.]